MVDDNVTVADIKSDVRDLLEKADQPEVSDIRPIRRRAAAAPELDDLAETLMEFEQAMKSGDESVETLINELGNTVSASRRIELTMAAREPFPSLRKTVLTNFLDHAGGRVIRDDGSRLIVQVPDEPTALRVKSMYHWMVASEPA